jgi:hypothetical protein
VLYALEVYVLIVAAPDLIDSLGVLHAVTDVLEESVDGSEHDHHLESSGEGEAAEGPTAEDPRKP